jgi:hypothetical protein
MCLQLVIEPSLQNTATAAVIFLSSAAAFLYLRNTSALAAQPLSAFAIFGFCFTTQYGALVFQSIAWTAVSASLYAPLYTFSTLAFYQAIAIGMHSAYRFVLAPNPEPPSQLRRFFSWGGLYFRPSNGPLWIIGATGLVSYFLDSLSGVPGKIALGFNFLTWAPFLIPLYSREDGSIHSPIRRDTFALCIYAAVVCVLGLALNQRVIMMTGGATIALLYLFNGMRSDTRVTPYALVRTCSVAVLCIALLGPISNLATAMVIARAARGKIPASEMISNTIDAWRHPNLIAAYRADQRAAATYSEYDEYYLSNPIVARLVESKFHDNALHFAGTLTTPRSQRYLRDMTIDSLWYILPEPVLHFLGVNIRKDDLIFSTGDYLAYLSKGVSLGGERTGSIFAQGAVLLGPLFPFLYAVICVGFFAWMSLLTYRAPSGAIGLSAMAMMNTWFLFIDGVTGEGFQQVFESLLRRFPQKIIIYCLVLGVARFICRTRRATDIGDNATVH